MRCKIVKIFFFFNWIFIVFKFRQWHFILAIRWFSPKESTDARLESGCGRYAASRWYLAKHVLLCRHFRCINDFSSWRQCPYAWQLVQAACCNISQNNSTRIFRYIIDRQKLGGKLKLMLLQDRPGRPNCRSVVSRIRHQCSWTLRHRSGQLGRQLFKWRFLLLSDNSWS